MKNVGTYYSPYVNEPNCCVECNPNRYFDPYLLWDKFPCPPPWNQALFLKIPWNERLGEEDGDLISSRIAKRCGLDVNKLRIVPGAATSSLLVSDCDLQCFLLIAAFICILLVALVVAFVIKRRGFPGWKLRKVIRNNNGANPTTYNTHAQYGFPNQKQSEAILSDGDVQTRLIDPAYNQRQKTFQLGQYTVDIPRENNMYDTGFKRPKLPSEDTSAFYSGTDTTHTYDSLHGSSHSGSVRLSDNIQRRLVIPAQSENYNPEDNFENVSLICPCEKCSQIRLMYSQFNRSNSPRGSVGQCSCNRCSQNRLFQSEIYYGSDSNPYFESPEVIDGDKRRGMVSDTETLSKHNKKKKKRKNKDIQDNSNKSDNDTSQSHSQDLYSRPDDINVDRNPQSLCMCAKCVQLRENFERAYRQGQYMGPPPVHRCRCPCGRCSQMSGNLSDVYASGRGAVNSDGSEIYGIPGRTQQNVCPCKRCSQTSLQQYYRQEPAEIQAETETFPLKAFVPESEVNVDDSYTDHRKRRRSRPNSIVESSSDLNTGSEKSYNRAGVPRTNGSLYRTKFMYR